jgi:hypothetical protein
MCGSLLLCAFFVALTSIVHAQSGPRSYVYSGVAQPFECAKLPQNNFDTEPSLARSGSDDRLQIKCQKTDEGELLLTMTFQLTDSPPRLERGRSRSYSFRWGANISAPRSSRSGEFTHDQGKCTEILAILTRAASPKHPQIEPSWTGGCYPEDRLGLVIEITLTESSR